MPSATRVLASPRGGQPADVHDGEARDGRSWRRLSLASRTLQPSPGSSAARSPTAACSTSGTSAPLRPGLRVRGAVAACWRLAVVESLRERRRAVPACLPGRPRSAPPRRMALVLWASARRCTSARHDGASRLARTFGAGSRAAWLPAPVRAGRLHAVARQPGAVVPGCRVGALGDRGLRRHGPPADRGAHRAPRAGHGDAGEHARPRDRGADAVAAVVLCADRLPRWSSLAAVAAAAMLASLLAAPALLGLHAPSRARHASTAFLSATRWPSRSTRRRCRRSCCHAGSATPSVSATPTTGPRLLPRGLSLPGEPLRGLPTLLLAAYARGCRRLWLWPLRACSSRWGSTGPWGCCRVASTARARPPEAASWPTSRWPCSRVRPRASPARAWDARRWALVPAGCWSRGCDPFMGAGRTSRGARDVRRAAAGCARARGRPHALAGRLAGLRRPGHGRRRAGVRGGASRGSRQSPRSSICPWRTARQPVRASLVLRSPAGGGVAAAGAPGRRPLLLVRGGADARAGVRPAAARRLRRLALLPGPPVPAAQTPALDEIEGGFDSDRTGFHARRRVARALEPTPERFLEHPRGCAGQCAGCSPSVTPAGTGVAAGHARLPEIGSPCGLFELPVRCLGPIRRWFRGPRRPGARLRRLDDPEFDPSRMVLLEAGPVVGKPASPGVHGHPQVAYERIRSHDPPRGAVAPGFAGGARRLPPDWLADDAACRLPLLHANDRYCALRSPGGDRVFTLRFRPAWPRSGARRVCGRCRRRAGLLVIGCVRFHRTASVRAC